MWEYMMYRFPILKGEHFRDKIDPEMNRFGEEGWEAYASHRVLGLGDNVSYVVQFKRWVTDVDD